MNLESRITWFAVTLWIAALPCQAEPAVIRVRLQDYAQVNQSTLKRAEETASWVLRQAGIQLSWADCPTRQGEPSKDSICGMPLTSLDLQIRVFDEAMAKRAGMRTKCMGYALVVAGEFNSIAVAYFHQAVELESHNFASRGVVLGGIMAHEIGHLLEVRHSGKGVMQADWKDEALKALGKGRLWFTAEQTHRMAAAVAKRAASVSSAAVQGSPRLVSSDYSSSSEGLLGIELEW